MAIRSTTILLALVLMPAWFVFGDLGARLSFEPSIDASEALEDLRRSGLEVEFLSFEATYEDENGDRQYVGGGTSIDAGTTTDDLAQKLYWLAGPDPESAFMANPPKNQIIGIHSAEVRGSPLRLIAVRSADDRIRRVQCCMSWLGWLKRQHKVNTMTLPDSPSVDP